MQSIDQIRDEIAAIEQRIAKLRVAEAILTELEGGVPAERARRGRQPKIAVPTIAAPASVSGKKRRQQSAGREGSTPQAILGILEAQGPMPRAEIESAIRADRDIGKQTVSVALQRLRGAGKIRLRDNKWGLKK
ncbi:hypothetical protein [Beijerinckia indica]|uniref:Uncharacterized protein n=1 Tax=Beijerinckia indica subsp. indica (strain ATCC 9039 / DSM 1715 / NCIMB 8712) TaxID=395963 RepID=B2IG11_BEII9|nr:hypothetical protein [Beijerinckia indica]ACB95750.1 hypothetical protein Bind_2130 [Beijerinckia indica subsp. indica ATCC 9039]